LARRTFLTALEQEIAVSEAGSVVPGGGDRNSEATRDAELLIAENDLDRILR